jgi:hypothetical protein
MKLFETRRQRGTIYHDGLDDETMAIVMEAAEYVYGIPFRSRWKPTLWFRNKLKGYRHG